MFYVLFDWVTLEVGLGYSAIVLVGFGSFRLGCVGLSSWRYFLDALC
jgi:hypothetical protein